MESIRTIWMGIGIFERLYSNKKLKYYFETLDKLENPKVFMLADEITGSNNFVLSGKKFDMVKDIDSLKKFQNKARDLFLPKFNEIVHLIKGQKKWKVEYWNFLSRDKEYIKLRDDLREAVQRFENHYLKKEILKITIFGFGARLRKNFTHSFVNFVFDKNFYRYLETLSEYTIEEIAAIFYFAKKGWIKAGHEEEKPFDELSMLFYERFNNDFLKLEKAPEFYYF